MDDYEYAAAVVRKQLGCDESQAAAQLAALGTKGSGVLVDAARAGRLDVVRALLAGRPKRRRKPSHENG